MHRDVKKSVVSCDICQRSKPKKHAPIGLLQPLPIPERPFETVTMDFISELPESNGYNSILVIVDKLTKFATIIPTHNTIDELETAQLFFSHIVSKYRPPRQIVSGRDSRWTGTFWKEVCRLLKVDRALITTYHPQSNGQTKAMNQILETALRTYTNPKWDNWFMLLDSFALTYNNMPHTSTTFVPSFVLYGFHLLTSRSLLHWPMDLMSRLQPKNLDRSMMRTLN